MMCSILCSENGALIHVHPVCVYDYHNITYEALKSTVQFKDIHIPSTGKSVH